MSGNATQDIIEFQFEAFHKTHFPKLSRGDAFMQFTARIALNQHRLDESDIASGIVDGKYDGGIDTFHIIANRTESITKDTRGLTTTTAPPQHSKGVPFDVVIVQSKSEASGWDEKAIWKLRETIELFLDPKNSIQRLREEPLNERVLDQVNTLRRYQKKLISLDPVRTFTVYVMSPAAEGAITKPMRQSALALQKSIASTVPSTTKVVVEIIGAEGLEKLRTRNSDVDGVLGFAQRPVGVTHGKSQAWLGLVSIKQYLAFIQRPGTTVLREEFFSTNVRDFAGVKSTVNSAILRSLNNDSSTSFWWMNNGITILADGAADQTDDNWLLTNPQIVNGLQTSNVIHEASIAKSITSKRLKESVLVRVIREQDPDVREAIIIGTNNQATVNAIQLYANDEFQVKLETYLESQGWHYERRRWQFRTSSKPASKVRTILEAAQATIAIYLARPDTARARPRDILRTAAGYKTVFFDSAPLEFYAKSLDIMEAVESYLKTPSALAISDDPLNDRYYIASGTVLRMLDSKDLKSHDPMRSVGQLKTPDAKLLGEVHARLYATVSATADKKSRDTLFKNRTFRENFLADIVRWNNASPRSWETKAAKAKV